MESIAGAALSSWNFTPGLIVALSLTTFLYVRGWLRIRTQIRTPHDERRLGCFLGGLSLVFLALASPLDAFDSLYLSAHMAQHLLLMMYAPVLILLGDPIVPILRGLPKVFVREALGPFLTWPLLRKFFAFLSMPVTAWLCFVISTLGWHLPSAYELAIRSPGWHAVEHACFFWTGVLFWYPIIRPSPSRYPWPLWVGIPYLMTADIVNTALSAFFIFSGKFLYPSYAAVTMGSVSGREDQTLAGAIMWVPGSLIYLIPVVLIAMSLLSPSRQQVRPLQIRRPAPRKHFRIRFAAPRFRRFAQYALFAVAAVVVADGLLGPPIAPLNLAGTLPWIHWRGMAVIALLLVGNLFCMSCPFTLFRDWGRKLLPANRKWPRALRNKWIPFVLIAVYLWTYEAYSLWNRPAITAWIIVGYFLSALIVDGVFRGASFCKYVCPIGQFHFVGSFFSPTQIAVRQPKVCEGCKTYDCIRGNEVSRGCELYLFQPKKAGNMDCTFCLDCVKACPHENVGFIQIAPAKTFVTDPYRSGIGKFSQRSDIVALALLLTFGAFVNAAGMVSPVMMWEHHLHALLGPHAMPWILGAFTLLGAVFAPFLTFLACKGIGRLTIAQARRFAYALVPVGFAMWLAHLLYHLGTSWSAPLARLGVNLVQAVPSWLTPLQMLCLDAGLLFALYLLWRMKGHVVGQGQSAAATAIPWALVACCLYGIGVWILFQPMQMRGMMMN